MSRSDGQFPPYTKLQLDPNEWPSDFFTKSRECVECGFLWPHPHVFDPTPCCNAGANIVDVAPDIRWPDALKRLLEARFNLWYEEYNDGLADEQLDWESVLSHGEVDEEKAQRAIDSIQIPEREPYKGIGH